ncbi:MAG: Holliday junction branch migration protein RuvA [Bacteroidota bacterium]
MIAFVRGKIAQLEPTFVVIDCGGIGYLLKISLNTYSSIKDKESIMLHTYFQVREDAQVLFGFSSLNERELFELLISISGVGGNTAITILSSISPEDLFQAIQNEDSFALKQIKGIGAKTAGRIILELKDKVKATGGTASPALGGAVHQAHKKQEALVALTNLGFPKAAMAKRVDKILKDEGADISVADIIKIALRNN